MSQNYNINMKKFNGTDYDGLLPLAYNALNSQQLDGKTFNEIQNLFTYLYSGQYTGTGTYGRSNPNSITFPFEPVIFIVPQGSGIISPEILNIKRLTNNYVAYNWSVNSRRTIYWKISQDGKTISWYSTDYQDGQLNSSNAIYYYAAIGGYDMGGKIPVGATFAITSSESWRVPDTGRYMLELYGMGGRGYLNGAMEGAQGGASCQHYDSIALTKGDIQQIVIGDSTNTATKFGTYSVNNAGTGAVNQGGVGTGNRGKNGIWSTISEATGKAYGTGELSSTYGWGGSQYDTSGGPGAVYLKYLGT